MTKDNDESVIVSLINDEVRPSVALYTVVWCGWEGPWQPFRSVQIPDIRSGLLKYPGILYPKNWDSGNQISGYFGIRVTGVRGKYPGILYPYLLESG